MAKYNGTNGAVKIGATSVGEINKWEFSREVSPVMGRAFGATIETAAAGVAKCTGTISGFYDPNDSGGQDAIVAGATVALDLYLDGTASSDDYHQFTAVLITNTSVSVENDNYVTFTASFHANALPTLEQVV